MYVPQLTFTRFIAALLIVFFHFAQPLFPFTDPVVHTILATSNVAVSFFFLLSGFVMVVSSGKKDTIDAREFYKKRFLRIYPIYVIAMLGALVHRMFGPDSMDFTGLYLNIFLIQAWVPMKAMSINYPAWSISVEVFFYLLFPFIFNYLFKKFSLLQVAIVIILFFIATQISIHQLRYSDFYEGRGTNSHYFILFSPLLHLATFLAGNLTGQLFLNNQNKGNYFFIIIAMLGLVVLALLYPIGFVLQNGILSIFYAPMIYFIAKDSSVVSKVFSLRPFIFLGDISYAIYILQNPIFIWMKSLLNLLNITNPQCIFYFSLFMLLLVSAAVYVVVERIVYSKNVLQNFWSAGSRA